MKSSYKVRRTTLSSERIALFLLSFTLSLVPLFTHAAKIQILHTNDLHAALYDAGEPIDGDVKLGGWAQVKTVMDNLTDAEALNGIPTLRFDAGDFTEGSTYYFPDKAFHVMKAFQSMGYNAAALGNHDWLMGAKVMNRSYGQATFNTVDPLTGIKNFPILAANVKFSPRMGALRDQILPHTQITVGCTPFAKTVGQGCVHIGVFGLTTPEAFYKWITKINKSRLLDMRINGYVLAARREIRELRKTNDVVIALTHIGFSEDKRLAAATEGLDLIIGGHSHSLLKKMEWVKNKKGIKVPIVQVGYNGMYVGKIMMEVTPGKPAVISPTWDKIKVLNSTPVDKFCSKTLLEEIKLASEALSRTFTDAVLNRSKGCSDVPLVSGSEGGTAFAKFVVDSMQNATGSELALDIGQFHGNSPQPAGDVTRKMLMEMYPRTFDYDHDGPSRGWGVWEAKVPGWLIKLGMKYAVQYGIAISTAGIHWKEVSLDQAEYDAKIAELKAKDQVIDITQFKAQNVTVDQKFVEVVKKKIGNSIVEEKVVTIKQVPISNFHEYTVAAPEGLLRGAYGVTKLLYLIIHRGHPYRDEENKTVSLWDAMENYLEKIKYIQIPTEKFATNDHSIGNRYQFFPQLQHHLEVPTKDTSPAPDPQPAPFHSIFPGGSKTPPANTTPPATNPPVVDPAKKGSGNIDEERNLDVIYSQFWKEADQRARDHDYEIPGI